MCIVAVVFFGSLYIFGIASKAHTKSVARKAAANAPREVMAHGVTYTRDTDGLFILNGPVMDTANILDEEHYSVIDQYLRNIDNTFGVQVALLTLETMYGEPIETVSLDHATKWQLGQKGVDNGALLTISMEEHSLRIETGYGTEGTLTDAKCAQIIRDTITPEFKKGNYQAGIEAGLSRMVSIITSNSELISNPELAGTAGVISDSESQIKTEDEKLADVVADSEKEEQEKINRILNEPVDEPFHIDGGLVRMICIFLGIFLIIFLEAKFHISDKLTQEVYYDKKGVRHVRHYRSSSSGGGGGGYSGGGGGFGGGGASGSW